MGSSRSNTAATGQVLVLFEQLLPSSRLKTCGRLICSPQPTDSTDRGRHLIGAIVFNLNVNLQLSVRPPRRPRSLAADRRASLHLCLTSTRMSRLVSTQFSSGNVSHRWSKVAMLSLKPQVSVEFGFFFSFLYQSIWILCAATEGKKKIKYLQINIFVPTLQCQSTAQIPIVVVF